MRTGEELYEKISEESPTEWARVPGPNGITIGNNALYIASISKDFSSVTEDTVIYRIPDFSAPEAEVLLGVPDLQRSRILEFAANK